MTQNTTKRRPGLGWLLLAVLVVLVLYPVAAIADVMAHGPYVTSFNHRLMRRAQEADLMGADSSAVETTLGTPSSVSRSWSPTDLDGVPRPDAVLTVTYNYAPYPWFPHARFQVHLRDGRVFDLEMSDDSIRPALECSQRTALHADRRAADP